MDLPQKKKSLFAQQMSGKREQPKSGPVMSDTIVEKSAKELELLEKNTYFVAEFGFPQAKKIEPVLITEISQLPSTFSKEMQSIHMENLKKIGEMSESEIKSALDEINGLVSPSTLEVLRRRGQKKSIPVVLPKLKDVEEEEMENLQQKSQKTCMHSLVFSHFYDKIRFDEEGNTVQHYENQEWVGEKQGFTLRDIANMVRSTFPAQRVIAIITLTRVLNENFNEKLDFLFEECGLDKLLIFALADKNVNAKSAVLALLQTIFTRNLSGLLKIQGRNLMFFPLVSSKFNFLLSEKVRKEKIIWEEEINKTEGLEGDGEGDVIGSLLVKGLLFYLESYAIEEVLEILTYISFHSVSACYFIVRESIFKKIIEAIPYSYKLLSVLARASFPIAHKIKESLPERLKSDLFAFKPSKDLMYSLVLHNQFYDIRVISNELCMEGSSDMFFIMAKSVNSLGCEKFQSIAEIAVYKYLKQWEKYIENSELMQGICRFLYEYYKIAKNKPISSEELCGNIRDIIENTEIAAEVCIEDKADGKYLKNLQNFFEVKQWEDIAVEKINMLQSLLQLVEGLEGKPGRNIEKIGEIQKFCVGILEKSEVLPGNSYDQLLCYRLKPVISLLLSCINLLPTPQYPAIFALLPFLSNYDEAIYIELLRKTFSDLPGFYLGYTCSQKHLLHSINSIETPAKLSCFYLGLNENPYFPLQFNWAFLPLTSEPIESLANYLEKVSFITHHYIPHHLSSIITDINMFFIRKDINYQDFSVKILEIIEKIASSQHFAKGANAVKNSILNMVKDFIAYSYLESTYVKWIVSFLRDDIEIDLYKDILEEIGLMIGRFMNSIDGFIGGKGIYTRFLRDFEEIKQD